MGLGEVDKARWKVAEGKPDLWEVMEVGVGLQRAHGKADAPQLTPSDVTWHVPV